MNKRRLAEAVSALLLGFGLPLATPVAAHATDFPCEGPPINLLVGAEGTYAIAVMGARARIEYRNPDLCGDDSTSPSSSNAWAMVTDERFDNTAGWAQTGWAQDGQFSGYTEGIHEFAQYTLKCKSQGTCTDVFTAYGKTPNTGSEYYSASFNNSTRRIDMVADGAKLTSTNYDPTSYWDPSWEGQYYGETFNYATDVPGIPTDHLDFDHVQWYDSSNVLHFEPTLHFSNDNPGIYYYEATNPSSGGKGLKIWTDR